MCYRLLALFAFLCHSYRCASICPYRPHSFGIVAVTNQQHDLFLLLCKGMCREKIFYCSLVNIHC